VGAAIGALREPYERSKALQDAGVDLLEISGGSYEQPAMMDIPGMEAPDAPPQKASTAAREAYFVDFAKTMRASLTMPLLVTGGFRTRRAMNAALEQGYMLADLAFNAVDPANVSKLPKWVQERMVNGKLPPQEMAKLHAAIRNKAGAFDRLAYQNKQLQTQLAELKKQLGNYKSSEPGEGEKGRTKKSSSDSITDVFSSIDRMASRR
jgi:hypothetical protein